ncbi:MAG: hypothetical protein JNJ46_12050 [Myxococcales bacterium]|nr:hypothetical protein [Myxococcales bacterium]
MSRKSESLAWLLPVALVGAAAAGVAAVVGTSKPSAVPPTDKQTPAEPMPTIAWFGGSSRENIDGLAFLFASENEHGSLLLWALQALAANTFAKQLGRAHAQVKSIADMLKSGIHKPTRKRLYGLQWGPQYDKEAKIKRWAATSAGQHSGRVAWHFFEFAERLLRNQIALSELRGRRGETMPPESDWQRMTSFLQYEGFGETVLRQAGEEAETDPDKVLASWGSPRLIASVEGVRFYGH